MVYRLSDKYGEAELVENVEKWRRPPQWFLWWINGAAMGFLVAWVVL